VSASHDTGEQEVRTVTSAAGGILAALGEDRLCLIEGALFDQWLVCGGEVLVVPADAPEICRVGEDAVHGRVAPACGGRGCVLVTELVGDGDRAEAVCDVELVDPSDRWCGDRVGHELAVVEVVAEGWASAVPAAFAGATLDPRGDAVDDRGVLELGEYAEHLHHPAGW
jgi:hypothetical protein